jgi:predicted lipoprotein with Yx(FWY)xxD motif
MQIRKVVGLVLLAGVFTFGVSAAFATRTVASTVKTAKISGLGTVLVNGSGRTLYRFTADKKGASTCNGSCAALWPPVLASGTAEPVAGTGVTASKLGTIKRSNGQKQVTYGGYPLYRYAADTKSGQAKGEGAEGTWFAVAPSGALVKGATKEAAGSGGTITAPAGPGTTSPAVTTPAGSDGSGGYDY